MAEVETSAQQPARLIYADPHMELARLRGYEMAVKDMARAVEGRSMDEHRYVYLDDNGGVCACGASLSWYMTTSSPKVELAKHITQAKTNE